MMRWFKWFWRCRHGKWLESTNFATLFAISPWYYIRNPGGQFCNHCSHRYALDILHKDARQKRWFSYRDVQQLRFQKMLPYRNSCFLFMFAIFDGWMFHRQAREQRSGGGELSVSQALRPPDPAQHRVLQRSMVPAGDQSVMLLAMLPPFKLNQNPNGKGCSLETPPFFPGRALQLLGV